ncbi:DNA polymerase lambda subunit, partial [Nannochloropsis gaditana CCMP526]|uniref:DNA polymerase lambda subunit n=1 Tax=Nannochloropsis gaditana (strain CCMP526) TaxID=1093141 RepID=UPI00029F6328
MSAIGHSNPSISLQHNPFPPTLTCPLRLITSSSSTPLRCSSAPPLKARVRSHPGILNENQRVGLRYYEEFQERIPRSEVRKIEERVREATEALYPGVFMLTTCGSYRRGASHCGDVDILLAPVSERVQARGFLGRLILHLEKEGFLTDHLTDATDDKSDSYFGVCRLGDGYLHRRLDLKWSLTDKSMGPAVWERGTAAPPTPWSFRPVFPSILTRLTRPFRTSLLELSSHPAIFPFGDSVGKKVADIGPRIVCTEEREIFHRLGLAYKRPWERNTHDAVSL